MTPTLMTTLIDKSTSSLGSIGLLRSLVALISAFAEDRFNYAMIDDGQNARLLQMRQCSLRLGSLWQPVAHDRQPAHQGRKTSSKRKRCNFLFNFKFFTLVLANKNSIFSL